MVCRLLGPDCYAMRRTYCSERGSERKHVNHRLVIEQVAIVGDHCGYADRPRPFPDVMSLVVSPCEYVPEYSCWILHSPPLESQAMGPLHRRKDLVPRI